MIEHIFIDLSFIIIIAIVISLIMRLLKQPLIIGYIITGILVSPYVFSLVKNQGMIQTFSQIGVAFLLFSVGLSLNPKFIKKIGRTALITGLSQIIMTFILGFVISVLFKFSYIVSAYISIALTFSSTIIILKLLSDKGGLESLHGRLAIGLLIVQDIVAVLVLIALSSLSLNAGVSLSLILLSNLVKGVGLIAAVFLLSYLFLPRITKYIAKSQEFLFLFSVGWCFVVSSLFYYFNFFIEIGALIAGITLSIVPYSTEISSKVKPLRDFFMVLFFVFLGLQIKITDLSSLLYPIIALSLFVFVAKPLIVLITLGFLGYTKRNSFMSAITLGQISEFSLIILFIGFSLGHLSSEVVSMLTLVGLLTIAGSSYMIFYSDKIYSKLSKLLYIFERKKIRERDIRLRTYDAILFGYNRIGFNLLKSLRKINEKFIVVDFNPDTIEHLMKDKVNCRYGDAGDIEMLNSLIFDKTKLIISTIPELETNLLLTKKARYANKNSLVIVIANQIEDALKLYDAGASYVLMPHFLGGEYASEMLQKYGINSRKFAQERAKHVKHLRERLKAGHEHPRAERLR